MHEEAWFQPDVSSMEAGSNGKPYQNLSISAKQNFNSDYHYMLFDWFLNFSLKWPPWRLGEGRIHFRNLRNDNPVYIKLGDWKILSE